MKGKPGSSREMLPRHQREKLSNYQPNVNEIDDFDDFDDFPDFGDLDDLGDLADFADLDELENFAGEDGPHARQHNPFAFRPSLASQKPRQRVGAKNRYSSPFDFSQTFPAAPQPPTPSLAKEAQDDELVVASKTSHLIPEASLAEELPSAELTPLVPTPPAPTLPALATPAASSPLMENEKFAPAVSGGNLPLVTTQQAKLPLSCIVGSVNLSLNQLSELRIGSRIPLATKLATTKIIIDHICIAEGHLIEINGIIGVRITSRFPRN
jgi:flagellar motor switch/type III secretory pathway protein FliN